MGETPGFPVKVTLWIGQGESEEERLLPSLDTLARNLRIARVNLAVAKGELAEAKEEADIIAVKQRLWLCRNQVAGAEQAIQDYEEAKSRAKATVYTIWTPDYGALLDLEDDHKIVEAGMPRTDMAALCKTITLHPEFVQGFPDTRVIHPTHMRRLWSAWMQEVYPDADEVPFF